jgi:2-phospho-L-lactate transferase/gluconeogenesis factor (CofD/UPF0052 family)/glycosyltransferase involved in cell wall biosynthesis
MPDPSSTAARRESARTRINVVLFSGGTGTSSITEALLRHPQIHLQILINAYDDGHSTGRLRKFIPTMLGPSDVRKNLNRLMPSAERCHRSLKRLSDHRLPVGVARADALTLVGAFAAGDCAALPAKLADEFRQLSVRQAAEFRSLLDTFLAYFHAQEKAGSTFDFTDCALGNLLFAGCYLREGRDFNRAVAEFSRFHEVAPDALLNITQGESLFLVAAKEDGSVLLGEGDIVAAQSPAKIAELFLVDEGIYRTRVEGAAEPAGGWLPVIREASRTPRLNPAAAEAMAQADVIVYGPGTQHSSLFPSYLTAGVGEAIAANRAADKIFVGNIVRDLDIQEDDVNDLARKFLQAMSRKNALEIEWSECVSYFFVQGSEDGAVDNARYIPFDPAKFMFPVEGVRVRDWESIEGRHAGGFVLEELQKIVQSRIDIELERIQHMVSIVVPVLNEAPTLAEVLKSLQLLNFQPLGMTKEIVVVDGGSTDGSRAIAQSERTVRVYDAPHAGRGAALRLGIEKARGSIIAFFPADAEYETQDLYSLVRSMVQSGFRAAFGTRAVKVHDLSEQLKGIYGGNRSLYLTSKYGGMLLSIVTLLLFNRFISDVLTSMKAFDAQLLRRLRLRSNGRDLETELCAKLGLLQEYVSEYPVNYHPRTRREGKKITFFDGLGALAALFEYRFRSRSFLAAAAPARHERTAVDQGPSDSVRR